MSWDGLVSDRFGVLRRVSPFFVLNEAVSRELFLAQSGQTSRIVPPANFSTVTRLLDFSRTKLQFVLRLWACATFLCRDVQHASLHDSIREDLFEMTVNSPKSLHLDITALGALARFTGIQRMLVDLLRSEAVTPVVVDFSKGKYRQVDEVPAFSISGREKPFPFFPLLTFSIAVRPIVRIFGRVPALLRLLHLIRHSLVRLFSRKFSPVTVSGILEESIGSAVSPPDLWLMDIPKTSQHIDFLYAGASSEQFRLHIYLFDLIPVDSEELAGVKPDPSQRAHFERYLSLVSVAASVTALSNFSLERLRIYAMRSGLTLPEPLHVLYPPNSVVRNSAALPGHSLDLRKTNHLEPGGPLFLAVAPFTRRKNLRVVLRAFREFCADDASRARLVVVAPLVGDVDPVAVLWALLLQARYPGRLVVYSPVSDEALEGLYGIAKAVLVPSLLEGFGLPILEARARGIRVVCSRIPVFEEVAEITPVDFASAIDWRDWVRAMKKALASPAQPAELIRALPGREEFVSALLGLQSSQS